MTEAMASEGPLPAPTMAPGTLPASMSDYLVHLATQRRAAALTLTHYTRDLARLQALLAGRAPEVVQPHDIRRFVATLHGQGLGARSIARTLSAWRGYFRWMVRHRGLALNPAELVRPPKAPRRLPSALSADQAKALLDADVGEGGLAVRDRAMFELFYSSGLRLAELAALDVDAGLDAAQALVTVTGKRGKTRSVPVGAPALEALSAWQSQRAALLRDPSERALFLTRTGRRMTPEAIRSRLADWARRSGLGVHVHPHMLRHSFASHVLQSSGDLRAVQELLGHASIRSTQVYTHLDFQHLARTYDNAHPRARRR